MRNRGWMGGIPHNVLKYDMITKHKSASRALQYNTPPTILRREENLVFENSKPHF